ncbi:hypothetical protein JG687_00009810 [Phytophthora cactorum]|uniref:Uncharacterized protein n=1 Tax=Phytophthora cactorum TaxID=29920 RepID=A0A8T1UDL5_9STRA|nr:hypothetical protein JG687_00009810 [Phytophthora cactorum]
MSVVVVLGSVLDLVSPIDERPLSLFQGSVSEWSDMRIFNVFLVCPIIIVYDTINCTQLKHINGTELLSSVSDTFTSLLMAKNTNSQRMGHKGKSDQM